MMNINDDQSQSSHVSEFDEEEESSVHSAVDDLILNKSNNSKSKKRKNIEENNLNHDGRITKIKSIEQNTLQHNNKNNTTRSNTCQYKVSPTTIMFDCPNEGTYKCSHCSFSFCLQHGLQHQQDLKDEIRSLLTKAQELSANVDKLNFIYLKSSLITQVDQWATRMHEKVEQTRNELHCTLDQWEKKIEEKKDYVKIHLENDLEKSVDCVLRKQLEQFEINKQEVEKANQELNILENLFHSLNNQQLIKINIDAENEMILNPPTIICSDIIVDGLNLKENSPEKIDPSNQQTNKTFDNPSVEINSPPSPPASPPVVIISPVQQHGQKSPNQNLSASSQQHKTAEPQTPTTFQDNPTITEPTFQLLDSTKPYKIGDKIKVGDRILQSDTSSLKYWLEDDITVTETASGGHILNMAGYSYFAKNHGKNFTTWECVYRRTQRCSSIIIRSSDPSVKNYFRIYSIQGEHIHEPAPYNVEVRKFKQRVRDRCRQELSSPRIIYEDELKKGKYSPELLAVLPTFYNIRSKLYHIRQEHLPTSPTDPNFILHPAFTSTDEGKRFLLYDSNSVHAPYSPAPPEVGRLLIYASDLQLTLLSKSKHVGSVGTFETAAQISYQIYIIMGEFEETHAVPLVFCLCERKNHETYKLIIQILKTAVDSLKLDLKPIYWMSDYEAALTKAIKKELPNTNLLGCAFHYNQAIYHNIQGEGLQDAYQNVEVVRQILHQIVALAFIPSDQIRIVYNNVIKPQINNVPTRPASLRQNLRNFLKYYESYWLTKIYKFCIFDQPIRTNNGLAEYNNKMNVQLSDHPHLYRLILWFEEEELLVQQLVMKVILDEPIYKKKKAPITILINDSLKSLWKSYNAGILTAKALLLESSKWIEKQA